MGRKVRLLPLLLLALLVFFAVRNYEDVPRMLEALGRIRPEWLGLAILFQILQYFSVGLSYHLIGRAVGADVPFGYGARMSVVNLFVNSALPSAGLSGNVFLVRMLSVRGVAAGTATLVVMLERVFYFAGLVVFASLVIGWLLVQIGTRGIGTHAAEIAALGGVACMGVFLAWAVHRMLKHPLRAAERVLGWIERGPRWARRRVRPHRDEVLADARRLEEQGTGVLKMPRVFGIFLGDFAVFVWDSLTVWALFHGIGVEAGLLISATAYAIATVVAQAIVIPGMLEVGLAGVLVGFGARTGTAVLIALLFHGLSLWAPMPFGAWFYRQAERKKPVKGRRLRPSDSKVS